MSLTLRSCNSAFVSRLNGSPPRCPLVLTHAPGSVDLTTRAAEFWSEGSCGFGLVVVGEPERFRYLEEGKFWFGFPLGLGVGWGSTSAAIHGLKPHFLLNTPLGFV